MCRSFIVSLLFFSYHVIAVANDSVITKRVNGRDIIIPVPLGFEPVCESDLQIWESMNNGAKAFGDHVVTCFRNEITIIVVKVNLSSVQAPFNEKQWQEFRTQSLKSQQELMDEYSDELDDIMSDAASALTENDIRIENLNSKKPTLIHDRTFGLITQRDVNVEVDNKIVKRFYFQAILNVEGRVFSGGASPRANKAGARFQEKFKQWAMQFFNANISSAK